MCGRYVLYDFNELCNEYPLLEELTISPNYNVAPTQIMPVVTDNGVQHMRWGLIPKWAKDDKIGYSLINARSETVFEKPMWKSLVTTHRCLVPANGFYEWQKRPDGKQPFYIHPKNQHLFMFAGIWDVWKHDSREWYTYSILTTTPNEQMKQIHDRMPVILHKADEAQWLAADRHDDIEPLLSPYDDDDLDMFEVSKSVNVVKTNEKDLILPINSR